MDLSSIINNILPIDTRNQVLKSARTLIGVSIYTGGAITGNPYLRLIGLRGAADRAIIFHNYQDAEKLANEMLSLAESYKDCFYYANAIHYANSILGLIALYQKDIPKAEEFLIRSVNITGSPQLNSFGPNMELAYELLKIGSNKVVLDFLDLCKKFWGAYDSDKGDLDKLIKLNKIVLEKIEQWEKEVKKGRIPDFGANMIY